LEVVRHHRRGAVVLVLVLQSDRVTMPRVLEEETNAMVLRELKRKEKPKSIDARDALRGRIGILMVRTFRRKKMAPKKSVVATFVPFWRETR
jgi:hypothetical protein